MVVNEDLSLNTRCFKIKDTVYTIVGTILHQEGKHDVVVNMKTGKQKKMYRKELKEMTTKFKAIILW